MKRSRSKHHNKYLRRLIKITAQMEVERKEFRNCQEGVNALKVILKPECWVLPKNEKTPLDEVLPR